MKKKLLSIGLVATLLPSVVAAAPINTTQDQLDNMRQQDEERQNRRQESDLTS